MHNKYQNQIKTVLLISCLFLLITGCSSTPKTAREGAARQDEYTTIGQIMTVHAPKEFTLLDNKDVLSADGLYYATWVIGNSIPYENSDGDTVDLYDAQLYLLASEAKDEKDAEKKPSGMACFSRRQLQHPYHRHHYLQRTVIHRYFL